MARYPVVVLGDSDHAGRLILCRPIDGQIPFAVAEAALEAGGRPCLLDSLEQRGLARATLTQL
jgi:hypothetical protein